MNIPKLRKSIIVDIHKDLEDMNKEEHYLRKHNLVYERDQYGFIKMEGNETVKTEQFLRVQKAQEQLRYLMYGLTATYKHCGACKKACTGFHLCAGEILCESCAEKFKASEERIVQKCLGE